jgi:stearoyl-CoA desaturase (delta-9 desaturase)
LNKYALKNIDFVNLLFLFLTPLLAPVLVYYWVRLDGFHWGQIGLGIFLYYLTGISITAGYHRLFSHRAYEANAVVKFIFLIFGAAAFQNSLLKWGSDHRVHHSKVDTEEDPYSIQEGFFHAHIGWIFLKKNSEVKEKFARDLLADKLVLWQHRYYIPIAVCTSFILPTLLGHYLFGSWLGGFAIGGVCRIVLVHHCTFFINSLCHTLGSTPYTDTNSAKDHWVMALLTFGEGYHNFHHYFQADYRNGIRWYHYDPTKWLIRLLQSMGLAFKLKLTSQEKILAARMQMRLKALSAKLQGQERFQQEVEALKQRVLLSLQNFQDLKLQYRRTKERELKARVAAARAEFEATLEAWNHYIKYLSACPVSVTVG